MVLQNLHGNLVRPFSIRCDTIMCPYPKLHCNWPCTRKSESPTLCFLKGTLPAETQREGFVFDSCFWYEKNDLATRNQPQNRILDCFYFQPLCFGPVRLVCAVLMRYVAQHRAARSLNARQNKQVCQQNQTELKFKSLGFLSSKSPIFWYKITSSRDNCGQDLVHTSELLSAGGAIESPYRESLGQHSAELSTKSRFKERAETSQVIAWSAQNIHMDMTDQPSDHKEEA